METRQDCTRETCNFKEGIIRRLFLLCLFVSSAHADIVVKKIFEHEPLTPAWLTTTSRFIVAATNKPPQIVLYSPEQNQITDRLDGSGGILDIISKNGWVAICVENGQRIIAFHESNPQGTRQDVIFDRTQPASCMGVDITDEDTFSPTVVFGSPGDQRIYRYNLRDRRVSWYGPISGPFYVRDSGNFLFTATDLLRTFSARPLIIEKFSGRVVAGDPSGYDGKSRLQRGYASIMHRASGFPIVHYLYPWDGLLHGFPKDSPYEENVKEFRLGIPMPFNLTQSDRCLAVLGRESTAPNQEADFIQVLSLGPDGMPIGPGAVLSLTQPELIGARRFVSTPTGETYISTFKGLFQVKGLYEGQNCHY